MAVINDPNTAANISRVGEVATSSTGAQHVVGKPLPSSVGHYRVAGRCALLAAQVANGRIFEVRNNGSNLIIPTRLRLGWQQTAAHTADIRLELDLFKVTGFTVLDTTNTQTLTPSLKRTSMSATNAQVRMLAAAGNVNGMTGGTLTKDTSPVSIVEQVMRQTFTLGATGSNPPLPMLYELLDDVNGTHPWVLAQNEGLEIENIVLSGAAAGSSITIDFSYAEVTAY